MPSARDEDLLETVGTIYEAALKPDRWSDAIGSIRQACEADSAFMISIDVTPEQGGLLATSNVDRSIFVPRLREALMDNPFIAAWEAKGAPSGRLFRAWDLVKEEDIGKWAGYDFWAKPLNFHWTIATCVYERQPFLTPKNNVTVVREAKHETFTEDQLRVMRRLMPHLQRSLLLHWRLRFHERKHAAAEEILNRLTLGVILLDHQGKVAVMNRVAEGLARAGRTLRVRQSRVSGNGREGNEVLRELVSNVVNTGMGRGIHPGGTVRLHGERGDAPLLVLATPLCSQRADARWLGPGVCGALFVSEPGARNPLSVAVLEQWFGFTPAEARVAIDLINGLDPQEISERRQVSSETVRSQTKAIYEKTGVNRRAQLVKTLLTSPAALVKSMDALPTR